MEEQNKRKAIILMIVGVITLIALVIGATFAYFQAQVRKGESTTLNVKAGTTDDLSFSLKDLDTNKEKVVDNDSSIPIVINANQTNFAEGNANIADGVTGTATLIAGDDDYIAEESYNVYLNITKNELKYSSYIKKEPDETTENILSFKDETKKGETDLSEYNPRPELYLTIKKNGSEITTGVTVNDTALNYSENLFTKDGTQLGGFDITETKGLIKISVPTEIKVEKENDNHTTTDTWEITVTFMNLDTDQNLNTGKSVVGEVLIQKKKIPESLADACTGEILSDCIKENYQYDGNIIHHNGSIIASNIITDLDDTSIIESGYKVTSEYADKYQKVSINDYDGDLQETHIIKFMCNGEEKYSDYYCRSSYTQYYYLDYAPEKQYDTYKKALQQAINDKYVEPDVIDAEDDSYRFSGSDTDVKNYVCLDSRTTGECETDDDLYRIIGLFKNNQDEYEIKLIKATAGTTKELGDANAKISEEVSTPSAYVSGTLYDWNSAIGNDIDLELNTNMWQYSNLNKVNLNSYFYNYITTRATYLQGHITEHTWVTGGMATSGVAKTAYDLELGENKVKINDNVCYTQGNNWTKRACTKDDIEYKDQIGLIYMSDYMYGTLPTYWTTSPVNYNEENVINNNWLYTGYIYWSISRNSSGGNDARYVAEAGFAGNSDSVCMSGKIHPSFYLTSDAKIKEGNGTKEIPYRLTFE